MENREIQFKKHFPQEPGEYLAGLQSVSDSQPPTPNPQPPVQSPQVDPVYQEVAEALTVKYAGFWIRYVAAVIDAFVLFVPGAIINVIFFFLGTSLGDSGTGVRILESLLGFAITCTYYILMTNKYQATLGKMAVGVRVVSDKGPSLTLSQIILRETVGKFVSYLTLYIGFIMAGVTERKQALHDKIAGTLVVYKDANKKIKSWVIVVVVLGFLLVMVAVVGLLASIVLVSLGSAREKANDAAVKSTIAANIPDALLYLDEKGGLIGFTPSGKLPDCSGDMTVNISPDGKSLAIFAKLCSGEGKYVCDDTAKMELVEVNEAYAGGENTACQPADNFINTKDGNPAARNEAIPGIEEVQAKTAEDYAILKSLDAGIFPNIAVAGDKIAAYYNKYKTYKSFDLEKSAGFLKTSISEEKCHSDMVLNISPDGKEFVVYQPLCTDPATAFCFDHKSSEVQISDMAFIKMTYDCK